MWGSVVFTKKTCLYWFREGSYWRDIGARVKRKKIGRVCKVKVEKFSMDNRSTITKKKV